MFGLSLVELLVVLVVVVLVLALIAAKVFLLAAVLRKKPARVEDSPGGKRERTLAAPDYPFDKVKQRHSKILRKRSRA